MNEAQCRELLEAVRYATMAPSTHNTQPWRFEIGQSSILVLPDYSRRLSMLDPLDRELWISLGCAVENLVLALEHLGYRPTVDLSHLDEDRIVVAFGAKKTPRRSELFEEIPRRGTNRGKYNSLPIPATELDDLRALALEPGVRLRLVTEAKDRSRVLKLVMQADAEQMARPGFREELSHWIRFNDEEARRKRDGLGSEAIGLPHGPRWLGSFVLKNAPLAATPRTRKDRVLVTSSPAVLLIESEEQTRAAWVATGRSFERVALHLSRRKIQLAHLNQAVEMPGVREKIVKAMQAEGHPQLLLRLGYAPEAPRSVRRDVEEVVGETLTTLLPGRVLV